MNTQKTPTDSAQTHLEVLVADDAAVNRHLALRLLNREGHRVTLVTNGQHAVEELRESQFDLVLMDVEMPVMDGLTASRAIREQEERTGAHTPIVALTTITDRDACLAAGMDAFLSKPLQICRLREVLDSMVDRKAA